MMGALQCDMVYEHDCIAIANHSCPHTLIIIIKKKRQIQKHSEIHKIQRFNCDADEAIKAEIPITFFLTCSSCLLLFGLTDS